MSLLEAVFGGGLKRGMFLGKFEETIAPISAEIAFEDHIPVENY